MKHVPIFVALPCLLVACEQPPAPSIEALAADASRLHALRAQCREGGHDGAFCAQVAQADLRRFLSGRAGPEEYQTLADLPPIPASFDEPGDAEEESP
ncbi:hypothetical protein [Burkholderia pseudomallei]|uniref:hypothetical protein n=1 Tax=Burkholderia pseudomallei TaxID=28450 RepID=UPI003F656834